MVRFLPGGAVRGRDGHARAAGGVPFDGQRAANHPGAELHDAQAHAFRLWRICAGNPEPLSMMLRDQSVPRSAFNRMKIRFALPCLMALETASCASRNRWVAAG